MSLTTQTTKLIWSAEALVDAKNIAQFYAEQVVERIVDRGSELPANPKLGRRCRRCTTPTCANVWSTAIA